MTEDEKHEQILNKISEITTLSQLKDMIWSLERNFGDLQLEAQVRLNDLEKEIQFILDDPEKKTTFIHQLSLLNKRLTKIEIENEEIRNRKKPHKCPVCDGYKSTNKKIENDFGLGEIIYECKSCEGKGIVWG